jgi:iron-sulfur cluster repair protein YtfE (RIC family)
MFAALSELEQDMHVHVQKENAVLFPRALELETSKRHVASVS